MGVKPGLQAYTYQVTGTIAAPTAQIILPMIRDETVDMDRGEIGAESRASNFRIKVPGLIEGSIETQLLHLPGDPEFDKIQAAFFAGQPLYMAFVDGPLVDTDAKHGETFPLDVYGLWGWFFVTNFSEQRALEEAIVHDVRFSATLEASTNAGPVYKKTVVAATP